MASRKPAARRTTPTAPPERRAARPAPTAPPPPVARARTTVARQPPPTAATEQSGERSSQRIKVRAIQPGYYDHIRRREDDVFYIADESAFSERWMERVDARTPERVTSAPEALRRQHDELLRAKNPAPGTTLTHDEQLDAKGNNPLGA
jgi:hypothetical protein